MTENTFQNLYQNGVSPDDTTCKSIFSNIIKNDPESFPLIFKNNLDIMFPFDEFTWEILDLFSLKNLQTFIDIGFYDGIKYIDTYNQKHNKTMGNFWIKNVLHSLQKYDFYKIKMFLNLQVFDIDQQFDMNSYYESDMIKCECKYFYCGFCRQNNIKTSGWNCSEDDFMYSDEYRICYGCGRKTCVLCKYKNDIRQLKQETLLSYALKHFNINEVEFLLKFGADPNFIEDEYENSQEKVTMLMLAKNKKIIKMLVQYGADIDKIVCQNTQKGYTYMTTLGYYVCRNNIGMARILLNLGANPNIGFFFEQDCFDGYDFNTGTEFNDPTCYCKRCTGFKNSNCKCNEPNCQYCLTENYGEHVSLLSYVESMHNMKELKILLREYNSIYELSFNEIKNADIFL